MSLRLALLAVLCLLTACADEATTDTPVDYRSALQDVCLDTTTALDDLPQPPEQISVVDFATTAADLLADEADQVRDLDSPDDLDDDHRAFIRNTDEQVAAWRSIAADAAATSGTDTPDEDRLTETTTRIGQLILGRNDLVEEMDAPACHRGAI